MCKHEPIVDSNALPGYEIGRELGGGVWGVVYEAYDPSRRRVAVKRLHPALVADADARQRFAEQGPMLAATDNPHLVPLYRHLQVEGQAFLVTELLEGGSLRDRQRSGVGPEAACALVLAACAGVSAGHGRGLLHRDLKPENLLFASGGQLKVTDFALAGIVGGSRTLASRDGNVLGAPEYMAPEQVRSEQPVPATDVYALATILYELLAGRLPFRSGGDALSTMALHVQDTPIDLAAVAPSASPSLVAVVMRGLAANPADRYASAEEFGSAVADAAAESFMAGWLRLSGITVAASDAVTERLRMTHALDAPAAETIAPDVTQPVSVFNEETQAVPVASDETIAAPAYTPPQAAPPPPPPAPPTAAPPSPPAAAPAAPAAPSGTSRRVLGLVGVAVAAVAIIVIAILLAGGGGGGEKKVTTIGPREITVKGEVPWTATGLTLKKGDDVNITATGTVFPGLPNRALFNDPNGLPNRPDLIGSDVVKTANHASLIGKVGDNGQPFNVGKAFRFTADRAGPFFLGINDLGLENNSGTFAATVTVTRS